MGAAAASANVCVKPVVQIMRLGQKEGEGGAMQMCHTMVFSGVNEPVTTVLVEKKKPFYLEALFWKFVK